MDEIITLRKAASIGLELWGKGLSPFGIRMEVDIEFTEKSHHEPYLVSLIAHVRPEGSLNNGSDSIIMRFSENLEDEKVVDLIDENFARAIVMVYVNGAAIYPVDIARIEYQVKRIRGIEQIEIGNSLECDSCGKKFSQDILAFANHLVETKHVDAFYQRFIFWPATKIDKL